MSKIRQTIKELEEQLREQIQFMLNSNKSYDNGFTGEAKRLANVLRLLLHDTKNPRSRSRSLLGQLDIKDRLMFRDTAVDYNPESRVSHAGLTVLKAGRESKYIPRLDEPIKVPGPSYSPGLPLKIIIKPELPFEKWWKAIIIASGQIQFKRGEIVLHVADTDGGAHVDSEIDKAYYSITRGNGMGLVNIKTREPVQPVERASVRQIAHEVITSLEEQYPQYF